MGFVEIADLGAWWEAETGLPIPLAGICARSNLDDAVARRGRAGHPGARSSTPSPTPRTAATYVHAHAQEL